MLEVDVMHLGGQTLRIPLPLSSPHLKTRTLSVIAVAGTSGKSTTAAFLGHVFDRVRPKPVLRATPTGWFLGKEHLGMPEGDAGLHELVEHALARGTRDAIVALDEEAIENGWPAVLPPRIAVLTNATREGRLGRLFGALRRGGCAVLNGCDPVAAVIAARVPDGSDVTTYGLASRGPRWSALDLAAASVNVDWQATTVGCSAQRRSFTLRVPAVGEAFVEDALAALAAATAAGVDLQRAARALEEAEPPEERFEVVAYDPYVVVDRARTADALARTIATARSLAPGRVIVVFGARLASLQAERIALGRAARNADRVVVTSDDPRREAPMPVAIAIARGLAGHADFVIDLDRRRAIEGAIANARRGDVVLLCGKGTEKISVLGEELRRPFSDEAIAALTLRGHA